MMKWLKLLLYFLSPMRFSLHSSPLQVLERLRAARKENKTAHGERGRYKARKQEGLPSFGL